MTAELGGGQTTRAPEWLAGGWHGRHHLGEWACGLSQKQEGHRLEEKVGTKGGFFEEWGVLSRGKEEDEDTNRPDRATSGDAKDGTEQRGAWY